LRIFDFRFSIDSTDKSGGLYHQEILGQKAVFFCENTASGPVETSKNPLSLVYGWSETGFLARILGDSPQQRQKPGFFGVVSLVLMRKSPDSTNHHN
jgi:hypothetical protein